MKIMMTMFMMEMEMKIDMMAIRYKSCEIVHQPGFGGHDPRIDVVRRLLCMLLEKHGQKNAIAAYFVFQSGVAA